MNANVAQKQVEVVEAEVASKTSQAAIETHAEAIKALNTSQKIRFLDAQGYTRGQIAKYLDKRYQHVRNVLITPVKKA